MLKRITYIILILSSCSMSDNEFSPSSVSSLLKDKGYEIISTNKMNDFSELDILKEIKSMKTRKGQDTLSIYFFIYSDAEAAISNQAMDLHKKFIKTHSIPSYTGGTGGNIHLLVSGNESGQKVSEETFNLIVGR